MELSIGHTPYPDWLDPGDRRRWDLAGLIAVAFSALHEDDGRPDLQFVWYFRRTLFSDRSLASPNDEELASAVADATAVELPFIGAI